MTVIITIIKYIINCIENYQRLCREDESNLADYREGYSDRVEIGTWFAIKYILLKGKHLK